MKKIYQIIKDYIEYIVYGIKHDWAIKVRKKCPYCGASIKKCTEEFRLEHYTFACFYKVCPNCHKNIYTCVML